MATPAVILTRPFWRRVVRVLAFVRFAQNGGAVLGLFGIVVLWGAVGTSLNQERLEALKGAEQNTSNLARSFEENIVRSIKAVDQTLLYIRDSYSRDPAGFDVAAWTKSVQALTDMTFQISLIDRDGMMIASNLAPTGNRIDLSDREHFRVHRDRAEDSLFISKPVLGRASNKWSIQLTRKIIAADGSFGGVIVVSLDPQYLSRFYDSVDIGAHGVVTLLGVDGIVRAGARGRAGPQTQPEPGDEAIGRSVAGSTLMANYAQRRSGTFTAPSMIDGIIRVTAYRAVRFYPLIVSVGIAREEVLAAHRQNRIAAIVLASGLTVVLVAVTLWIILREARLARARALLLESEASTAEKSSLLQTTLRHMSQGLMMIDASRTVQVCNPRAIEMLELPPEMMARTPSFDDVLRWQWEQGEFGDDGGDAETWLREFVQAGGTTTTEHCYERTRKDGTVLEIRSTPLPDGGMVRTYTDMTLRKQTEEVLRTARDDADRTARAKSEFLAMMSHEIRSPMSGMLGVLELLAATRLDGEQRNMAHMIQDAAASLLAVLNDILDFSKIEAGALTVSLEPINMRQLLDDIAHPHSVVASRKGVAVRLDIAEDVPAHFMSDPLRLRQIVNNLMSNAVKFTPTGSVTVTVRVAAGAAPIGQHGAAVADQLLVAVTDTGVGMAPEVVGRLFEPFMQADGSTTRIFGGTGLGLCISRRLARLLDGDLTATSTQGAGSSFVLSVPLSICTDIVPESPVASAEAGRLGGGGTAAPIAPMLLVAAVSDEIVTTRGHVLVADDDFTNRWLIQHQLQRLGLRASVAADGASAFAMLCEARYDLLITDGHMPGMDGVALTQAIRSSSDPVLRQIPVIGLTADVTETQRMRCERAGMTEIMIKPMKLDQLGSVMARYLDGGEAGQGSSRLPSGEAERKVFDPTTFNELFPGGDPEGLEWIEDYRQSARGLIATMIAALGDVADALPNGAALRAAAHRLVGASLSVGAVRLGEQARRVEHLAQSDRNEILPALRVLEQDHSDLERALTSFLADIEVGVA